MRKVTQNTVNAFVLGKDYSEGNTSVSRSESGVYMYLHGNIIAIKDISTGKIRISNCGWFTQTTKERLNALPNVEIKQLKGKWFLNGKEWDGKLIEI